MLEQLERVTMRPGFVLKTWGQVMVRRLNADQRKRYEAAKATGVIETKQLRAPTVDYAFNAFCHWCRAMDRPVVELRRRIKYARVSVDLGMTSRRLNDEQVGVIRRKFIPVAVVGRWYMSFGPQFCAVKQVAIEDAAPLASWLVEYCQTYVE